MAKYWGFSFSISLSNECSGLISFRIDWFDLLAVPRDSQESSPTPQFKSINSLALSFLYSPTLTSIYLATGKIIALTRQIFVGNVSAFEYAVWAGCSFLGRKVLILYQPHYHNFWSFQGSGHLTFPSWVLRVIDMSSASTLHFSPNQHLSIVFHSFSFSLYPIKFYRIFVFQGSQIPVIKSFHSTISKSIRHKNRINPVIFLLCPNTWLLTFAE